MQANEDIFDRGLKDINDHDSRLDRYDKLDLVRKHLNPMSFSIDRNTAKVQSWESQENQQATSMTAPESFVDRD